MRENIRLPLRFGSNFRPKEIEGRVDVILAQLRLTRVADLRPAQTNAEERRRAALARALAFDPELVVMEEPFDGLTDRVAGELLETARGGETAAGGRRTVLVTGSESPGAASAPGGSPSPPGTRAAGDRALSMRTRTADALIGVLVLGAIS